MAQQLVADALIEQAQKSAGLEQFDSDSYREGLDVVVAEINSHPVPEAAMERLVGSIIVALATRLQVADYLRRNPELLQRPVERPVFVFGIPRTGTTLLSNLLAADPGRRSPLTWEIDDPVPPATTETLYTDPRAVARLEAEKKILAARPEMGKYYRNSAIYPNECMFFMQHDFKGLIWQSRGQFDTYRDWLFQTDMTSAYEYHKRFLQLLQARAPGTWNLKMPSHALWLETLLAIYPDARLVWTHRDPFTATGSFCSLITLSHQAFVGHVDAEWIGRDCAYQAAEHANRAMDARERIGHDRIVDVHYADLMREPLAVMRQLYAAMDNEFTREAEAGMRGWLKDNPQDKFGRHEYKLDQFGLSVDKLQPAFERYMSRYEVEREG